MPVSLGKNLLRCKANFTRAFKSGNEFFEGHLNEREREKREKEKAICDLFLSCLSFNGKRDIAVPVRGH